MNEKMQEELKRQIAEGMINYLPNSVGEIIIREGAALPVREPVKVNITGVIDAPARFVEKRKDIINHDTCHILVDRENMTITLQCAENNHYGTKVTGVLEPSPEFEKFGINKGEYMTHFEMAELFKMNRSLFENKSVAMRLVSDLQNFKAKVDREVEESNNNRGDKRLLYSQAVQHNLPDSFKLNIPLFKGQPSETIEVEVYIDPSNFNCTLVSPQANDLINETRDEIIDAVLEIIQEQTPNIVIIEQ